VTTSPEEALWVLRAQCGDRQALELLLRSVQPSLLRYLRGLVGVEEADDLLQDVLVLLYRKLGWLRDPALFRPWAFRIASRTGFRYSKRKHALPRNVGEDTLEAMASAEPRPTSDELDLLSIEGVSPASRAVLVLHFQEEMTLSEVAAVLELPIGTVTHAMSEDVLPGRQEAKEPQGLKPKAQGPRERH
jgi:RNA polymerase sigma-70 factor, ECF subfamily